MASGSVKVGKEGDDLLTCNICLETYKTPKYLPCLHTFCKVCIHTYILSTVTKDKHENKGFSCPVCRQFVSIGERSSNRECWAEELPNNHLIISMIDRQSLQKQEKLCNVCELSDIIQKAVSWCTVCQEALCCTCENYHRKFKMSSNHKILTLQEVQADKTTAVSGSTTCEDHSDKFIEIYCVDHNKPCCTVCATVKHRKCEKVVVIEDAAAGVKESKQTMEFLELIMLWKMILDKSIEGTEKNVVNVENLDNNIFSEIESLKKDIIEHVNKMEKAAKDELTITKKEILIQLTDKLTEMSSLKSTIDNWHRILSTCVKDGSDIQCLIEMNKLIPMKDKIEADIIKATSDIDEKSFSFERNRVVENFEEMVKSLGQIRIETKHETVQSKSLSSSINSVPNQKEPDFNETIQSGSQGSSSIDMVPNPNEPNFHTGKVKSLFTLGAGETRWSAVCGIFTEEFIFISNLYKKKLLKFNLDGVFHSDIQFHNGPYDIAKFRENELAVAFIDSQEVQLINIHTMTIGWKIVLSVPVGGLRYMNSNNQFVTACDKCIVWLNASNGQKFKETKTNGNTFYVCASEKKQIRLC